jgi:RNA polymerase sigma-70 factor (ECF subfamily)
VPAAEEESVLAESVGLALMVVLERLSPTQRVAFVLHDLFAVPFDEIGRLLDRSEVAAKKLASRARERVHGRRPEGPAGVSAFRLAQAFLAASRAGDIDTLLEVLAPGVVRRVDPELVGPGVAAEVRGARAVAEETRHFTDRARAAAVLLVDGQPGLVVAPRGRLLAVLRLTVAAGRITVVDVIGAPERLRHLALTLPQT